MQSSLIGKIEKARRYAEEKSRISFSSFAVNFKGDNEEHNITLSDGHWKCNCSFFQQWGLCSHTMALQKILGEMLPEGAQTGPMVVKES